MEDVSEVGDNIGRIIDESNEIKNASQELISALFGYEVESDNDPDSNSIYKRLLPFMNKAEEALDPAPVINNALSELVLILQGNICKFYRGGVPFSKVGKYLSDVIDKNEVLSERAAYIRDISSRAESRLELYYVKRIVDGNEDNCLCKFSENIPFAERIAIAGNVFPYVSNYTTMVEQESRIICGLKNPGHIVFCGSGPLPFTGLLLAAHTKAKVTFVDNDENAIKWSKKLLQKWEKFGVLQSGKIDILHSDVSFLKFRTNGEVKCESSDSHHTYLVCDVLFIAALIPSFAKKILLEEASSLGEDSPLVVVRSAHGLTARLAYKPVERAVLEYYLPLVATVVPVVHASSESLPPEVDEDDRTPMRWFPPEILNSLEIYGRTPTLNFL